VRGNGTLLRPTRGKRLEPNRNVDITSERIIDKLWRGTLPAAEPVKLWGGSGPAYDGCDLVVTSKIRRLQRRMQRYEARLAGG
jgi:hypothetical protein